MSSLLETVHRYVVDGLGGGGWMGGGGVDGWGGGGWWGGGWMGGWVMSRGYGGGEGGEAKIREN